MDIPLQEKTLAREGCVIRYWVSALPGRPWLVLLHGAGADHRTFNPQLGMLAPSYSLLLPDQRGQGLSRPAQGGLRPEWLLDDLLALLDAEGVGRAAFIGHSLGGNLAQEFAYRRPERVTALVLVDCTCNTMALSAFEGWAVRRTGAILAAYPWKALLNLSAAASAVRPAPRAYFREVLGLMGKAGFIGVMAAGTGLLHHDEDYRIAAPFLLVCGDRDGTGNIRACAPKWAAREPNCEFHWMKGAGHAANMDSPEEFNGILEGFLKKWLP